MRKRFYFILLVLQFAILFACSSVEKKDRTVYSSGIGPDHSIRVQAVYPENVLRVATINLAHGRKDSFNQLFLRTSTIRGNLDDIAAVFGRQKPHVIALQEADAASFWSGSFDHVAYLAAHAHYPWRSHAINSDGWFFSYGTALLSVLPFTETVKHTFESSLPTLNKGFVLVQIDVPYSDGGDKTRRIDVISVHLDFSRQSVRQKQIDELQEILSVRMNPTVILGDFNSEWLAESSTVHALATKSRFMTYEPGSPGLHTYKDKRLDWILITRDLEFIDYRVLPDTLSDHAMVVADIHFKQQTGVQ